MRELEISNREQIEALNQRGGRTLSIVDLLLAGTISAELAGHVGATVARGASFLTAANPGGAGKTALLAALLGFLPEGRPIVTVDHPGAMVGAEEAEEPSCYLVHEIGSGHWYGYLWGAPVQRYLELANDGHAVASCLHADTMADIFDRLTACGIGNPREAIRGIEFVLFMYVDGSSGRYRRRVVEVWERAGETGQHQPVSRWEPQTDRFVSIHNGLKPPGADGLALLLKGLAEKRVRDYAAVREACLDFFRR